MSPAVAALAAASSVEEGDPLRAALAAQADKYRLLAALSDGEAGRYPARREAMRAVADRFPGALREREVLPRAELDRRRAVVEHLHLVGDGVALAARLAAPEHEWLRLTIAVQERLREALAARRIQGRSGPPATGSRLSARVRAEVAREQGISVEALEGALFPSGKGPQRGQPR